MPNLRPGDSLYEVKFERGDVFEIKDRTDTKDWIWEAKKLSTEEVGSMQFSSTLRLLSPSSYNWSQEQMEAAWRLTSQALLNTRVKQRQNVCQLHFSWASIEAETYYF